MLVIRNRAQVMRKRGRFSKRKDIKKGALFVPRRIYRSVRLLTLQYTDLVQLRARLRRRARRGERRVLRLNKKIKRAHLEIEKKFQHLLPKKRKDAQNAKEPNNTVDVTLEGQVERTHSKRKIKLEMRKFRRIRKRLHKRVRAVKKINRAHKRTTKKAVRTMSNIRYLVRYIRERIQETYGKETPYATGNLLSTEYLLHKFLNLCMRDGKKYAVVQQFIKAIKYLKQEYKVHPIAIFRHVLLDNEQLFDYRVVRMGRHKTIVVPIILEGEQRILKPLRFILDTVRNARTVSDTVLEEEDNDADDVAKAKSSQTTEKKKKVGGSAEGETENENAAKSKESGEKLRKMPFYMHLAHTMLYFVKNESIMQEKSLEITQIAHDNKRNISRIMPVRKKKRGERYSRNGLLWRWSKTRTYGGIESHYYKRALRPVPLRLADRLYK